MRIKVCGITSYADAMLAVNAGAHALGFIFYKKSPRYITPQKARDIIKKLPPFVEKVALFVNEKTQKINEISKLSAITLVQLHFQTTKTFQDSLKYPFIEVIRAKLSNDLKNLDKSKYYIVDSYCQSYGGCGIQLNLEWFNTLDCSHIILAGGLTPENVYKTKKYGFYAVDVNSGIEASYGIKDPQKLSRFILACKL